MNTHSDNILTVNSFKSAPASAWLSIFPGKIRDRARDGFLKGDLTAITYLSPTDVTGIVASPVCRNPRLVLAGDRILPRCECAEFDVYRTCLHVGMLAVAILESGEQAPAEGWVSATPAAGAKLGAIYLEPDERGCLALLADRGIPEDVLVKCGFTGSSLAENFMLRQEGARLGEKRYLLRLVSVASSLGYEVRFREKEGALEFCLTGNARRGQSRTLLALESVKRMVLVQRGCYVDGSLLPVIYEGEDYGIVESGDLITGDNEELTARRLLRDFVPVSAPKHAMPAAEFNRRMRTNVILDPRNRLFEGAFIVAKGEEPKPLSALPNDAGSLGLEIRTVPTGFEVSLKVRCGSRPIRTEDVMERFAQDLINLRSLCRKVRTAGAFAWVIAQANQKLGKLVGLEPAPGEKAALAVEQEQVLRNWLNLRLVEWGAEETPSLLCFPGKLEPWRRAALPWRRLIGLVLALWPLKSLRDFSEFNASFIVTKEELPAFIRQAAQVCPRFGADLFFRKRRVTCATVGVAFAIDIPATIGLSLFDPIVEGGGISVPCEQWSKLLSGELCLVGKGKTWVVPLLNEGAALAAVQALLKQRRRVLNVELPSLSAEPASLALLEWLYLNRAGVKVPIPQQLRRVVSVLKKFDRLPSTEIPASFVGTLRPYQRAGVDWIHFLYDAGLGAVLADEMGLGKTPQAIAFLASVSKKARHAGQPMLVVCPASVVPVWRRELARFCPSLRVRELPDLDGPWSSNTDVILSTYDGLARRIGIVKNHPFYVVVIDEAQFVKNYGAKRRRAIASLQRRFTLALTGTPLENRVEEYVSILDLSVPGFAKMVTAQPDDQTPAGVIELASPFVMRRTKHDVLSDLPKLVREDIVLDLAPDQLGIYQTYAKDAAETIEGILARDKTQAGKLALFSALTKLRQVCVDPRLVGSGVEEVSPKLTATTTMLREQRVAGKSTLVFSQFTHALDLLQDELREQGIAFLRLDGSTATRKRGDLVVQFQESEQPLAFLISLRAGGTGLTLTRANMVVMLDNWWNPAVDEQAIARAHRITQLHTVTVRRLIMRGTVEEKILALQVMKQALFDQVVARPSAARQALGGGLTTDDFKELLKFLKERR